MGGRVKKSNTYPTIKYFEERLGSYKNKYLIRKYSSLNEASTRLIVNHLLADVFLYKELEEFKVEPFIGGMFFDYIVQFYDKTILVVEVKARGTRINFDHLLQVMSYALTSGSRFAMITDGDKVVVIELNRINKRFKLNIKLRLELSKLNKYQLRSLMNLVSKTRLVARI